MNELIGFVLLVLKGGLTYDFAAFIMQFDQSRAVRHFEKGLSIIHDALFEEGYLPLRSFDNPEHLKSVIYDTDTIIIDGTEQRIQRPHDYETQRSHFSGKKKAHTYKSLVISDLSRYIYYVSEVYIGKDAEITILDTEFDNQYDWFADYKVRVDLGFAGFTNRYPKAELFIPNKRPKGGQLTDEQKAENRQLASERIAVEHSIGGMKRYDILTTQNRIHRVEIYNKILATCAGIWNLYITR